MIYRTKTKEDINLGEDRWKVELFIPGELIISVNLLEYYQHMNMFEGQSILFILFISLNGETYDGTSTV